MKTQHKQKTLNLGNLEVKLSRGKFSEYTYRSPFYGNKRAWRYDTIAFIYINGNYIEQKGFKHLTIKKITEYFETEYKQTPKYLRLVNK